METENLFNLLARFKRQPLITIGAVLLVVIIALAGMWFSGYLGEKGRLSAIPTDAVSTGNHYILPVSSNEREYLLISPKNIMESLKGMTQLQSSLFEKSTYKGKWIRINGPVNDIYGTKEWAYIDYYIGPMTGRVFVRVDMKDKYISSLSHLKKGAVITVDAQYDYTTVEGIQFHNGELVQ